MESIKYTLEKHLRTGLRYNGKRHNAYRRRSIVKGFDRLISAETGIPVFIAEEPLDCVVLGTGKVLRSWIHLAVYCCRREIEISKGTGGNPLRRILSNKIFILVTVIIILLTLVAVSHSERSGINIIGNIISIPAAPLQKAFTFVDEKISDFFGYFEDVKETKKANQELLQKVNELERQLLDLDRLTKENKELREALNFKDQYEEYEFVGSSIIAKDPGNWFEVFTINRGKNDKITTDSPVITAYGLVGRVSKPI